MLIRGCGVGHDAIRLSKLDADVTHLISARICFPLAKTEPRRKASVLSSAGWPQSSSCTRQIDLRWFSRVTSSITATSHGVCQSSYDVIKPGGIFLFDELYTHHLLQQLRKSSFGCWLRSKLVRLIYPYAIIDVQEAGRKLSDYDLTAIRNPSAMRDADISV